MGALGALTAIGFVAVAILVAVLFWDPIIEVFERVKTAISERVSQPRPVTDPQPVVEPKPALEPEAAWKPDLLTPQEKELAESLLAGSLQPRFEEVEGEHTYSSLFDSSVISFSFVRFESGALSPIFISVVTEGERPLDMDELSVRIGDDLFSFPLDRVEQAATQTTTEEVAYEEAARWKVMLDKLMESDDTTITLRGPGGERDVEIPREDIEGLRNTVLVYRYLGGVW